MKDFHCVCGQRVFFDNTECLNCGRRLGFEPEQRQMLALEVQTDGRLKSASASGEYFWDCYNYSHYAACNWLVPVGSHKRYCRSCRLNKVVPDLSQSDKVAQWRKLEAAKRHLLYSLMQLGLPVQGKDEAPELGLGLAFAFLEDQRFNAKVQEAFVATGHARGLITLNLAEADDVHREKTRQQMGEYYRTLIGHFRHESGHYYFDLLVKGKIWDAAFRRLFGDPDRDYQQTMRAYYASGGGSWTADYITAYACSHPLEDWAETWAHYLHMMDTLETAEAFGVLAQDRESQPLEESSLGQLVERWRELTTTLNALNRSMGQADAYPFVLTEPVLEKLRLVHRVVNGRA